MKLAIHNRPGSFSDRWIAYCDKQGIDYKLVNAFDSNIIQQVNDCDAFMWHHHHAQFKDVLTAKRILFALEHAGIKVFPNFKTGWHFDDKVAQKYLLEAIDAPLVPSYVFYDKQEALDWANTANYPKVFKLKGGAGAENVKLVKTKKECIRLIRRSFGRGFAQFDRVESFKDRIRKYKSGDESFTGLLKGFVRLFISTGYSRKQPREKGYVYIQEYIPDNKFDLRVVVIAGKKAVAEKRYVREGDFRASGSGKFSYDSIDKQALKVAFFVSQKLDLQSVAFDFIYDSDSKPLIVEISYGFGIEGISKAPYYWDENLNCYEGRFSLQELILCSLI